jgi:endonuclease YncB( thermonuclease family)
MSVLALSPTASASVPASAADRDCADFPTQAAAQAYFLEHGGPASDPDRLDSDGDGIVCESNPCPCSESTTPTTTPPTGNDRPARSRFYAVITAVVDGDTVKVRRGRSKKYTVRLIGIDTPETKRPGTPVECGGPEATSSMFRLAFTRPRDTDGDGLFDRMGGKGRRVELTSDPSQDRRDRYGRLLAYVKSTRGSLATAQLRAGWATVYVFEDPFEQLASFQAAEAFAKKRSRGVWKRCGGDFHRE